MMELVANLTDGLKEVLLDQLLVVAGVVGG